MNIQQIKLVTWVAAFAAAGGLGWEVFDFFQRKPELMKQVDGDEIANLLREGVVEAEPLESNHVDSKKLTNVFHTMDWSGKKAPEPEVVNTTPGPVAQPKKPMAELLTVLVLQEDLTDPKGSVAYVKYTDPQLKPKSKTFAAALKVDDRLPKPHEYARVAAITSLEGIRFAFDDEEREEEVVGSKNFPTEGSGIAIVGEGGAVMPVTQSRIHTNANYVPTTPKVTQQTRRNEYRIGTETAARINRDYAEILSREVDYRVARNPSDGSIAGLQVTKVAPGSVAAEHGITAGEVVKSINGHKVRSVSDAVAYVKKESGTTTVWKVVFEKQGREFTRTYESPVE